MDRVYVLIPLSIELELFSITVVTIIKNTVFKAKTTNMISVLFG